MKLFHDICSVKASAPEKWPSNGSKRGWMRVAKKTKFKYRNETNFISFIGCDTL